MPTVLDEILIKVGLDGSAFQTQVAQTQNALTRVGASARTEAKSLEEYLKKTQEETGFRIKQVEEVGRQASQQFTSMKNNVLGLFGAIAGAYGLGSFFKSIIEGDAALGAFAKTLGISTEDLATWIEMGKRAGVSADAVKQAFVSINQIQQDILLHGTSAATPMLNAMGLNPMDDLGRPKQVIAFLKEIGEWAKNHPPEQLRAVFGAIGLPPEMIPLLNQGKEGLDKLEAAMRALGVAKAKNDEEDRAFLNQWYDLQQIIRDAGRSILSDLMPGLIEAAKAMKAWLLVNKDWIEQDIAKYAIAFSKSISEVPGHFKDWKSTMETLAVAAGPFFIAMAAGFNPILAAVLALTAALVLLKKEINPSEFPVGSPFWRDMPIEEQLKYPNSPESIKRNGQPGGGSGSWLWDKMKGMFGDKGFTPTADTEMPPHWRSFLDAVSIGESSGYYGAKNPNSSAHGRYQFLDSTDREVSAATGLSGQDPVSQDRKAKYYATKIYRERSGRDLDADLQDPARWGQAGTTLNKTWTSLPGGSEQNTPMDQWLARMQRATDATNASKLPTPSVPPKLTPISAIDPGYNFALRGQTAAGVDYSRTSSVETHINGPIQVQTAATDADGIAKGIGEALRKYAYVPQVNTGLA